MGDEAIRRAGRAYQDLVMAILEAEVDPVEAVRSVFTGAADALAASEYRDLCPVATVALEVASSNERLRVATADVFDQWVTTLTDYLIAAGVRRSSGRALATVLVELLEGAFMLGRSTRDPGPVLAAGHAAAVLVRESLATAGTR